MKCVFSGRHVATYLTFLLMPLLWGCGEADRSAFELMEYYHSRPQYDKALEVSEQALAEANTGEQKAHIYVIRGQCYLGKQARGDGSDTQKLLQQAIEEFTTSIELNDNAEARWGRRMAYRLAGNDQLAAQDYERIRELDPNYSSAYVNERPDEIFIPERPDFEELIAEESEEDGKRQNRRDEDQDPVAQRDRESEDEDEEPSDDEFASDKPNITSRSADSKQSLIPNPARGLRERTDPTVTADKGPVGRYTEWLSQHSLDPNYSSTRRTDGLLPPPELETQPDPEAAEDEQGDTEEEDASRDEDQPRRSPVHPTPWPAVPNTPPPHTQPSVPTTGIVGPPTGQNPNWNSSQPGYTGIVRPGPPTGLVGPTAYPTGTSPAPGMGTVGLPTTGLPTTGVPTPGLPTTGVPTGIPGVGVPTTGGGLPTGMMGIAQPLTTTGTGLLGDRVSLRNESGVANPFSFVPQGPVGPTLPERPQGLQPRQLPTRPLVTPRPSPTLPLKN